MIKKLEIDGVHMSVDDNTRRYVIRKIGGLDKYIPKAAKEACHAEVMLKKSDKGSNPYTCEVTLFLPREVINAKEATVSIFAATDIVHEKLRQQILKYKEKHYSVENKRHLLNRFRKKTAQNS